ncbi:Bud site selection protein 6 [Mucor velutinosus]|uniref:Chromatin modification-related protein n=1 Tax=Mucor velutinosus TaxID=708070 RepID=A0AAN7DK31_9FUNG|nr:Bud site selection protein 6 [Mucor velutinosus]
MTRTAIDNLIYIDDYIDTVEALQIDLQKNFTLLKEMDGYAQDSNAITAKAAIDLIDNIDEIDANERFIQLKALVSLLEETAQRSSEKAALAKLTSDAVDRHCNRLDADLVKFEETQPIGTLRIASLPGLTPSSRSLREYSKLSSKEKISKKISEKSQSAKKRRVVKDDLNIPRVLKEQARSRTSQDKGKPIKALPSRKNNGKPKSSDSEPIDPNEQLYCYCQQVSFGEMVACDNKECDVEWFHIACVDLKTVPKGKWYCDNCSKYKGKQRRA